MWTYERRLEYPVNITKTNAKLAKVIITQFGGLYCRKGAIAAGAAFLVLSCQFFRLESSHFPFGTD